MLSLWEKESFYTSSDVIIIIGAGITGLFISIALKSNKPALKVRVLEAGSFPSGASVKNAGFACFGSLSELLDDIDKEGESIALQRIEERYKGIQSLLNTVSPTAIDYLQDDGFELFSESEGDLYIKCRESLSEVNEKVKQHLGYSPYSWVDNKFGFATPYPLLRIKGEGALHSGKLVKELIHKAYSLGVTFNFGFAVQGIEKSGTQWSVQGNNGELGADKVIVCTNGFSRNLLPEQDIIPARGQLLLTEPLVGFSLKGTFHANEGYYYFRPIGNRLLIGGGRHLDKNAERTDSQETTDLIQQALEGFVEKVILPGSRVKIDRRWAGTMAFGKNNEKTPIIQELDNGLIVAARLGGMGVAMAPAVAKQVSQYF